jgi:hypothetical protein
MDSLADEVLRKLEHLELLRGRFEIRADTLPADLTLAGLYNELRDAVFLAVELSNRHIHVAAFPLARMVFEATQRVIALATDDDYVRVGARAWLYYLRKDKRIIHLARDAAAADEWYEHAIHQLQHIWSVHNPAAVTVFREENARLDAFHKKRAPDNFMGEDLGQVVDQRHSKMSLASGRSVLDLKELDRGIYAGLSRESHSRVRLDPAGLRISSDGTVTVIPQKVDEATKKELVLGCLSSSLTEANAALAYLVECRQRQRPDKLQRRAADLTKESLPSNFKPDLGLHLMRSGGISTAFQFANVPINKFGILPDGTVSWSRQIALGEQEEYIATFDIPRSLVAELASALDIDRALLLPTTQLKKQTLTLPAVLALECRLGEIQQSPGGSFVPLTVIKVAQCLPEGKPN